MNMSLANGHVAALGGEKPSAPDFAVAMDFDGDSAYLAGGTAAFQAFVRATAARGALEVLTVIDGGCGAANIYVPIYDKAADKLMVMDRTSGLEVVNGDYSGSKFHIVALCK
jgi:hypothetical protein